MFSDRLTKNVSALALVGGLCAVGSADAAFVSYHDFGAVTGSESTGNITTHQVGDGVNPATLDTSAKSLIRYSDGVDTGVDVTIVGANGMDSRNSSQIRPPAGGTDADTLFNVPGLDLSNGTIFEGGNNGAGFTTFTLTGLNPNLLYDLAFYGDRNSSADGVERFILLGADAATNSSSTGIVDAVTTDMQTRPNAIAGNVVRWTAIDPGADGTIQVTVDPEVTSLSNIAYLSALRLEEAVPEPSSLALLGIGGLMMLRRSSAQVARCRRD